jgi:uncharacterized protein YyaL (SSP411 family)
MSGGGSHPHTNRLARETSPYLLQHQHNPVDWYPWGDEAFAKAKAEGKPIFLSIGYSTCHWCHVMERESFESEAIAGLLNRDFVSIKVDREERPDIDNVYMTACQLLTRSGGWPLTVFLAPDGRPFHAGTYFPPEQKYGRPGMRELLPQIARLWKEQRKDLEAQADEITQAVLHALAAAPGDGKIQPLDRAFADSLLSELAERFDAGHGGFGSAPKFPPHGALHYLLERVSRSPSAQADRLLRKTLDGMRDGGIFDQVGGGFHRYSVDREWFIPHFEKMLTDNAQLLEIYAAAARRYGDAGYRETAERIVQWMEREMRMPEGAYATALDADAEGVEGKSYLWTAAEIDAVLGSREAPLYFDAFDIRDRGNAPPDFAEGRGKNLPRRVVGDDELARRHGAPVEEIRRRLAQDNRKLLEVRDKRVPPSRDDKVVTSANALAVSALARASLDLEDSALAALARRVADFLLSAHDRGGLLHVSRGGQAKIPAYLDDTAYLAGALLDLAEATGQERYRREARRLGEEIPARFSDRERGGFFQTASSGSRGLLDSAREFLDQAVPSPNAAAIAVLRRLSADEPALRKPADSAFLAAAPFARAFPSAAGSLAALALDAASSEIPAPPAATRGPVHATLAVERGHAVVALEIEKGWHIQSHRPSRSDLLATTVIVAGPVSGEPAYPEGQKEKVGGETLSVYTERVEIRVPIQAPATSPGGNARVTARVEFQPCDAKRCLAPEKVELSAPWTQPHPRPSATPSTGGAGDGG